MSESRGETYDARASRRIGVLVLLCVGLAAAPSASAYTVKYTDEGNAIHWRQAVVPYFIDPTLSYIDEGRVKTAVINGFQAWNDVGARLMLQYAGTAVGELEGASASEPNTNIVRFAESQFPYDATVLAVTLLTYDARSGEMLDADIVVNAASHRFTTDPDNEPTAHDIQNTIAHEAGHFIGMAHEPQDESATMYPVAMPGESDKRTLGLDDEAGMSFLYPGPSITPTDGSPVPPPDGFPDPGDLQSTPTAMAQSADVTLERVQLRLYCAQSPTHPGGTPLSLWVLGLILLGARRRNRSPE